MTTPQSASIVTTPPGSGLGTPANTAFDDIKADLNTVMTLPYTLVQGTWGVGALVSNVSPITQNGNYSGPNANAGAAFSMFLRATDTGTTFTGGGTMWGFSQNLVLNSASITGNRGGGSFAININAATGNAPTNYVALASVCNMRATDGTTGSSAFGGNLIGSIPTACTVKNLVGTEIDVNTVAGCTINSYRAGFNVVDISSSNADTQGVLADFGYGLHYANFNANAAGASHGFQKGFEFGGPISYFPVSSTGTIIYAENNSAATGTGAFTCGIGIDMRHGTFTGYLQHWGTWFVDGSGNETAATFSQTGKQVLNNNAVGTYTFPANSSYVGFTGTNATTIAFTLPAAAAAIDGRIVTVFTHSAVSVSSTWTSSGATFVDAPATLAAASVTRFIYDHASLQWLRA